METKISSNLQRCIEIADQLQDSSFIKTRDGWQENTEVLTLAQELERLIEDLFVMTRTEDAREASTDQQLRDADIDPDALVERAMKKTEQPLAGDTSDILHDVLLAITEASVRSYQSGKRAGMEEK